MTTIADIILDDSGTLSAHDWDFDPTVGTGANVNECPQPRDWDSTAVTFDPWVTA